MKIYTFFKKPDDDMLHDDSIPLSQKYALYAVTPTKSLAKIFQKSRDMNQFIMQTIECDEGEEYDMYLLRNRSRLLNWYWLISYRNKNTDNQEPYWIHVVLTANELDFTMETTDTGAILNRIDSYIPVDLFEGKTKDALHKLKYHKAMASVLAFSTEDLPFIDKPDDGDFWDIGLTFDMFAIFMVLYKSTFSTDFFDHTRISNTQPE